MNDPMRLSDDELQSAVVHLAARERGSTAALIAHLAELYRRRLHERAGFSSLFTYCLEFLRLSEHEAYDRMKAAKVVRRFPEVLRDLESGDLNLTTVRLLAPHLSRANHQELLTAAHGKRKRQVQELVAARFPRPDVPASIRKVPARQVVTASVRESTSRGDAGTEPRPLALPTPVPIAGPPPPLLRPLAPDRYQVTFTGGRETRELLEQARDLLRHAVPSGDPAEIVTRALRLLVEDLLKKKFAMTNRPHAARNSGNSGNCGNCGNDGATELRARISARGARLEIAARSTLKDARHISADVRRAVYVRDRGQCTFVGSRGRRCSERAFLEFDHHPVPFAAGGPSTADNLELRCRAHNQYLAEQMFGRALRGDTATGSATRSRRSGTTGSASLMATPSGRTREGELSAATRMERPLRSREGGSAAPAGTADGITGRPGSLPP